MDTILRLEAPRWVSPYLLRPLRDRREVELQIIVRKAKLEGWAKGADGRTIAEDAMRAAQAALPDVDSSALADAIARLLRS